MLDTSDHALSVTDLTAQIRYVLEQTPHLEDVWVMGEVSNLSRPASGHIYFTLKDAASQIKCVMFKKEAMRQMVEPQTGQRLRVHGKVSVYEAGGQYQLYADQFQSAGGMGDLYAQMERLKAQLELEGAFDLERKRPLPPQPRKIGVVTSPDAAAFQDVQKVLRGRFPLTLVILSPTLVQGIEAPSQIVRAIERLNAHTDVDVIIVCRGGGSIEDLWSFNDERVVRAIVASRIPIISGVGHETDVTLADFAADHRSPTPSAAALDATPDIGDLREAVRHAATALQVYFEDRLIAESHKMERLTTALARCDPQMMISSARQRVDELHIRLGQAQTRHLRRLRERLTGLTSTLNTVSAESVLGRGYAIVTRPDGSLVTRSQQVKDGDMVTIRWHDGLQTARIGEETSGRYKRSLL